MSIKIPKPCSENWENMSPTSMGRSCGVCQAQIIDFTNWETEDIIQYIQNANGRVCGKLSTKQQAKNPFLVQIWKNKSLVKLSVGLALSSIIWIKSSRAAAITQEKNIQIHYLVNVDTTTIQGIVIDSQNRPLENVMISIQGKDTVFATNNKGYFTISLTEKNEQEITLLFRYIGYETQSIKIKLKKRRSHNLKVTLKEDIQEIGEIIIKPYSPFERLLQRLKI